MKSIDLFCASPASTAICSSIDEYSMVRHGTRTRIDRHTQRLGDRLNTTRTLIPCSSQLPYQPRPYHKARKSTSSSNSKDKEIRRKSSADIYDLATTTPSSPATSSRHLLISSDYNKPMLDLISSDSSFKETTNKEIAVFRSSSTRSCDNYPIFKSSPPSVKKMNDSDRLHKSSSSSSTRIHPSNHQVVELRVSIHCKGCEGKVRKHLSRMEGVSSFTIDFPIKKVTVIGDVTPLGVLSSISKVKNAAFWSSPTSTSSSSSSSMSSGRA